MSLVEVNNKKPAQTHADIATLCLDEAVNALEPRRTELLNSAKSHIERIRGYLTGRSPEEMWITYNELTDLLDLFEHHDSIPAASI